MVFSRLAPALALLATCGLACAGMADEPIETFTLKNGMHVVLIPSHRVHAVTHMLWYKVGAADDYDGSSGLAHYNEHMMFQGTAKTPAGQFLHTVSSHGGRANAFTSRDYTAYYVSIDRNELPLVMSMEADRMLNLSPTPQNFAKEREVIIEERRMSIENQPEALLSEEMQALLYLNHPYHTPVIGWMHEMKSLTREDVLSFHKRFYHPANATLVVAGDMTRAELEPLAQKYYGTLPAGDAYIRHWKSEPPERGPRHVEMRHPNVKQPELLRLYNAASVNTPEKDRVFASYILAQILGGGETSRLYQSLVMEQKLATSVSASYDGIAQGPGQWEVSATPALNVSLATLEAAIDKELKDIAAAAPDDATLERAKTLLKAETVYERDSMEGTARTLGTIVMSGLPADIYNRWPALVDAVTAADVQKAASVSFNPNQSVTGYLLPEGAP